MWGGNLAGTMTADTRCVRNQNYKFASSGTAITFTANRKSRRTRHFRFGHTGPGEVRAVGAAFYGCLVDHGEELMTDSKLVISLGSALEARLRSLEEARSHSATQADVVGHA